MVTIPGKRKKSQNHGKQKLVHFTMATEMFTIVYEDGHRDRVPQKTRKLTKKQRMRAIKDTGCFVKANPR